MFERAHHGILANEVFQARRELVHARWLSSLTPTAIQRSNGLACELLGDSRLYLLRRGFIRHVLIGVSRPIVKSDGDGAGHYQLLTVAGFGGAAVGAAVGASACPGCATCFMLYASRMRPLACSA